MHANELAGPVQLGKRPPDIDPGLDDTRVKRELRAKPASEESQRPTARPRMPRPVRYGAGF